MTLGLPQVALPGGKELWVRFLVLQTLRRQLLFLDVPSLALIVLVHLEQIEFSLLKTGHLFALFHQPLYDS